MAWLMVRVGAEEQAHEIDEDVLFIGGDDDAGIRLVGTGIAPKHCQVVRTEAGYRLIDLGSAVGTLVNGNRVSDAALQDGDVLVVGTQTMTFRTQTGASKPSAAPTPAAPTRAPTPQAGGGASRVGRSRGARRAGSRGASARAEAGAAPGRKAGGRSPARASGARPAAARADGGKEPLVRRRLRESNGMSESVLYTLIGGSVLLTGLIVWWFLGQQGDGGVNARLTEVQDAISKGDNHHAEKLIVALYNDTPKDHSRYNFVKQQYDKLNGFAERQAKARLEVAEVTQFSNNLLPFYKKYINDPKEAQYKNDTTVMRYFVEYRCDPYLERFAGQNYPNYSTVKRWATELRAKYDSSAAFPSKWWDYELISAMEEKREEYGVSYSVLNLYLKQGDGKFRQECEGKIEACLHRARILWHKYYYEQRILPNLRSKTPSYAKALSYCKLGWRILKDIPEFRDPILKTVEELRKAAEKDGHVIDMSEFT